MGCVGVRAWMDCLDMFNSASVLGALLPIMDEYNIIV
jgi:hypothetical protein